MNFTRQLFLFLIAGVILQACSQVSCAAPIVVDNFSFEADENLSGGGGFADGTAGAFGGQLTAWTRVLGGDSLPAVGWKDINAASIHPNPQVGQQESQVLSLRSESAVVNTTDTSWSSLAVGDTLTLTMLAGMRNVGALDWNEESFFGLVDDDADYTSVELGDTLANSGVIANNPATGDQSGNGDFVDVSFSYTVQASDLSRNGNIGILIYGNGFGGGNGNAGQPQNQSFFDNVRLDLQPVPEPNALVLLTLGCMLGLRRCRT